MKYIHACIVILLASGIRLKGMNLEVGPSTSSDGSGSKFNWDQNLYYQEILAQNRDLTLEALAFSEDRKHTMLAIAFKREKSELLGLYEKNQQEYKFRGAIELPEGGVQDLQWLGSRLSASDSQGNILTWPNPYEAVQLGETEERAPVVLTRSGHTKWLRTGGYVGSFGRTIMSFACGAYGMAFIALGIFGEGAVRPKVVSAAMGSIMCLASSVWLYTFSPQRVQPKIWRNYLKRK